MLGGLTRPDSGELRVLGFDVRKDSPRIKQRIGVQLQTAALYPHLTVAETMALFASFYDRSRPIDQLIAALGLTNLVIRRPSLEDVFLALTGRALRE